MNRDELAAKLAAYQQAELDILAAGQSYAVPGLTLTRANLKQVQDKILELEGRVSKLGMGNKITPVLVPCR